MRKFLDFVVRDDRPVITPPSEDEAEFIASHPNEPDEDVTIATYGQDGTANLKEITVDSGPTKDEASLHTNQSPDIGKRIVDVSTSLNHEISSEDNQPREATPSKMPALSKQLPDTDALHAYSETAVQELDSWSAVVEPDSCISKKPGRPTVELRSTVPTSSESSGSPPRFRELLSRSDHRLRNASGILASFASGSALEEQKTPTENQPNIRDVVSALREIAETMVWADQHEPDLWDTFMECSIMRLMLRCLHATIRSETESHNIILRKSESVSTKPSDHPAPAAETSPSTRSNENQQEEELIMTRVHDHSLPSEESKGEVDQALKENFAAVSVSQSKGREPLDGTPRAHREATMEHSGDKVPRETFHTFALEIQSQVLQTLSIMIQSVFRQHSLLCLFSSNHINEILSFAFRFEDDEMLGYFMSAVKTIALKLDPDLLQLFFDSSRNSFPLYNSVIRFFNHREQMVRIAVRNITLTLYALGDPDVLIFAARDESMYLHKTVDLLARLCGSVSRGLELLMDDGREVRRTRSRTGVFRQKVRRSDITARLEEIENLLAYLGDVSSISEGALHPLVVRLVSSKLFAPFFRPLASRASPKAIQAQKGWRLSKTAADQQTPALPVFDAAARCVLLACVLYICRSSCLGHELIRELSNRTPEFENRCVLHGLKAMASDLAGTERVSFVSLCAIEAIISCDATSQHILRSFAYDFDHNHSAESLRTSDHSQDSLLYEEYTNEVSAKESREEPLLMTLSEFEAPLTPSNSLPSTPRYEPPSPSDGSTPPKILSRAISKSGLSAEGMTYFESSDSGQVLSTFQLGEASLRDVVISVILVVRRREIRTKRVLHAVGRLLDTTGARTNSFNLSVEVARIILDEIAGVMDSFLRDKRTTIIAIERMFENFRSVAMRHSATDLPVPTLEKILRPDLLPDIAAELPIGASKRRRVLHDDVAPPTEDEDGAALFVMMDAYEKAVEEDLKRVSSTEGNVPCRAKTVLSTQVREILSSCSPAESYLDKREALLDVAGLVRRRENVN